MIPKRWHQQEELMCLTCKLTMKKQTHELLYMRPMQPEKGTRDLLIIQWRYTDVLLLLLAFAQQLSQEVWFKSGTVNKPRYIKVHEIKLPQEILKGLLYFHAVTGCDTTSQFTGIERSLHGKCSSSIPAFSNIWVKMKFRASPHFPPLSSLYADFTNPDRQVHPSMRFAVLCFGN